MDQESDSHDQTADLNYEDVTVDDITMQPAESTAPEEVQDRCIPAGNHNLHWPYRRRVVSGSSTAIVDDM